MSHLFVLILTMAVGYASAFVGIASATEGDTDIPLSRISASFQSDPFTGALTGSIPIEVPLGRNGMQPNLAVSYWSGGGNGWLGVGWKLEMGTIERQTRWGVLYNPTSAEEQAGKVYTFHLNGVSADLVPAPAPAPSNQYQMKIEGNFFRILKLAGGGWEVTDKRGTKYFFGTTSQARIVDPGDTTKVFKWCLERVEDRDGNYMTVSYIGDQGQGYLSQINYAGNGVTAPANTIKFYLEDRPDAADMYSSNFRIKTAKRLKSIEVKANGSLVRAYKATYSTSAATSTSLLTALQQYGKDATIDIAGTITGGSALPVTTLGYRSDPSLTSFTDGTVWINGWCPSGTKYGAADFNGDGKQDLWCNSIGSGGFPYMGRAISNGSGGFTDGGNWISAGIACQVNVPADLNADGKQEPWCMIENINYGDPENPGDTTGGGMWMTGLSNQWGQWWLNLDMYDPTYPLYPQRTGIADFNGDGKGDLWYINGSTMYYYFSTGSAFSYAGNAAGMCSSNSLGSADFNKDGRADFWCHTGSSTTTWLSTGSSFVAGPSLASFCAAGLFGVGDFNGDNRPDFFCHPSDGTTQISLSTGTAFTTPTTWLSNYCATGSFGLGDFNGDGKQDLWCYVAAGGASQVSLATGGGFSAPSTWLSNFLCPTTLFDEFSNPFDVPGVVGVGDMTGDGKADLYCVSYGGQVKVARSGSVLGSLDLLSSINNGLGGSTTISYAPSTTYTNTQLPFPLQTVAAITTNDGNGNLSTLTYGYSGGYFHVAEQDFRGFSYSAVTSPAAPNGTQSLTEEWFHQGNDLAVDVNNPNVLFGFTKGLRYRTKISKVGSPGAPLTETTTTYKADLDGVAPWYTPMAVVTTSYYDNTGGLAKQTQTEAVSYDGYGNLTLTYNRGDVTGNNALTSDDTTTALTYALADTTNWLIGFPTIQRTYAGLGIGGTKLSETLTYYDGASSCTTPAGSATTVTKGHVTKVERWLNGGTNPISGMEYNAVGGMICTRDPKGNTTTIAYDPTNTFPLTSTNALGHVTTTVYYGVNGVASDTGLYGQAKSVTDPNGKTTTSTYDALGRKLTTMMPDGLVQTMVYNYGGAFVVGTQHVQHTTSGGGLIANLVSKTYFDGLGRTTKTEQPGAADGGVTLKALVTETQYDVRGLVKQTSLPYIQGVESVTGRWTTRTYDELGRLTKTTNPDNTSSHVCYNGWTTTSLDPKLHKKVETKDAFGRFVTVQEYTGTGSVTDCSGGTLYATTTYIYNSVGNLLSVTDAKGNVSSMTYDTLGRKLTMHDPDMGDWSYTYDANGNLLTQVDAKNQKLCLSYDALNRRTQKNYGTTTVACGTNTVVYVYDDTVAANNGKGRLKQVTDPAQTVTFQYDSRGRIKQSAKTLDGTTYTITSTYDGLGRFTSVSYPTSPIKTVTYTYDGPQLKSVQEGVTTYVIYSGWNALGQAGITTFGNGATTTTTYANTANATCTQQSFRLCTLKTQKGANPLYQDLRYGFEANGNVQTIFDNTVAGGAGNQNFSYDDLDRLTLANGPYGASGINATLVYSYDQIGNMIVNPQVGTYSYPASGPSSVRPHAATVAGPYPISYDNNGNVVTMTDPTGFFGYIASYNTDNRLSSVTTTYAGVPNSANFIYDAEGRRVKKIDGVTTTRYISAFYECDTTGGATSCSRFIWAKGQRIATVPNSGGTYYYHTDHLGSTRVVTDATGAKVQSLTYYPYGDLLSNVPGTPVNVPYKYTGQELDGSSNLYFYEARYYHAVFGRFVSPDPTVANPRRPQYFNRYAYGLNNPLKYIDRSGYTPQLAMGVYGAFAGGMGGFFGGLPQGITSAVAGSAAGFATGGVLGFAFAPELSFEMGMATGVTTATAIGVFSNYVSQVVTNMANDIFSSKSSIGVAGVFTNINPIPMLFSGIGAGPVLGVSQGIKAAAGGGHLGLFWEAMYAGSHGALMDAMGSALRIQSVNVPAGRTTVETITVDDGQGNIATYNPADSGTYFPGYETLTVDENKATEAGNNQSTSLGSQGLGSPGLLSVGHFGTLGPTMQPVDSQIFPGTWLAPNSLNCQWDGCSPGH